MKRLSIVITTLFILAGLAFAADFWTKKPYTAWSNSESARILTDSPWSRTTMIRLSAGQQTSRTGARTADQVDYEPFINYVVSLRSAKPVRQARVRMMALEQKYDKMDAAAKAEFDQKWKDYVEKDVADVMVVAVSFRSNVPEHEQHIATFFQSQTLEQMKPFTFLVVSDGRKLPPVEYAAGQGRAREFQVAFERPTDLPPDATLTVEFRHPDIPGLASQRISAKFPLKNMEFDGAVTY